MKPLDKKDKSASPKSMSSIWNSISLTASKKSTVAAASASETSPALPVTSALPTTAQARSMEEFLVAWSSREVGERIDYVRQLEQEEAVSRIFSTEIPPQLLGDMLHTFLAFRYTCSTPF